MKIWVLFPAWGCYEDTGGRKAGALPIWGSLPWGGGAGGAVADGLAGEGCPQQAGTEPSTHRRWAWGMGGGGLDLFSISASVEHLLQIRVQEHPCGVQLFSDGTELWKGRIHFLKVFSGTIVGLWKQPDATSFVPWSWHFRGVSKRHPCVCVLACVTPLPPGTYVHMHTHAQVCTQCSSWEVKKEGVKIEH